MGAEEGYRVDARVGILILPAPVLASRLPAKTDGKHSLIQTDKKLLDLMITQLQQSINKHESKLPAICLKLLCNLSYSKHNKPLLVSNKDLHKTILTLLTNSEVSE